MVVEFSQMKLIEKQWNVYLMIENITTMIECVTEQCHCYFCNNDIQQAALKIFSTYNICTISISILHLQFQIFIKIKNSFYQNALGIFLGLNETCIKSNTMQISLIFIRPFNCKCKNCCISCSIISTDEHIEPENQLIRQNYSQRVTKNCSRHIPCTNKKINVR